MDELHLICVACLSPYTTKPHRIGAKPRKTCSRACRDALTGQLLSRKITLTCATCNIEYARSPSYIRGKHGNNFCSRPCFVEAQRKHDVPSGPPRGPLTDAGRKAIQNGIRPTRGIKLVHHWLTCAHCNNQFDDPYYGKDRKSGFAFCSLDCCNAYRVGANSPTWRGGTLEYYGADWRPLRRAARKRDGYICQRCGMTQVEHGRALDVHHIMPVSTFDNANDANTLNNVISLCRSCHGLTEWELRKSAA